MSILIQEAPSKYTLKMANCHTNWTHAAVSTHTQHTAATTEIHNYELQLYKLTNTTQYNTRSGRTQIHTCRLIQVDMPRQVLLLLANSSLILTLNPQKFTSNWLPLDRPCFIPAEQRRLSSTHWHQSSPREPVDTRPWEPEHRYDSIIAVNRPKADTESSNDRLGHTPTRLRSIREFK